MESSTWTETHGAKAGSPGDDAHRPPSAVRASRRSAWVALAYSVGGFLLLTVLGIVRLPRATIGTIWAEDGGTFLRDNLQEHTLVDIFAAYGGYIHVLPRILSRVAMGLAPLDGYAVMVSWLSCATVAAIGVATYWLSGSVFRSRLSRVLLAVIPTLLPIGAMEAAGNLANLHWYILWLVPWLILYRARHLPGQLGLGLALFVSATSEVQAAVFLPLLLLRLKAKEAILPAIGMIAGVALQVAAYLQNPREETKGGPADDFLSLIIGWVLHALNSIWKPDGRSLAAEWQNYGGWSMLLPLLLFLAALVCACRGPVELRVAALVGTALSLLFWTAAVIVNHSDYMDYAQLSTEEWDGFNYIRYGVAPSMFTLGVAVTAVEAIMRRHRASSAGAGDEPAGTTGPVQAKTAIRDRIGRRTGGHASASGSALPATSLIASATIVLLLVLGFFPPTAERETGPEWAPQVEQARQACRADAALKNHPVLVAPLGWDRGEFTIPCSELR